MLDQKPVECVLFLRNKKHTVAILLVLFLLAGIGIRLIDFTDLPLDFSVTRQFHSLIMSRGLYYQMDSPDTLSMPQDLREFGITSGKSEQIIEPPILEHLVAITYRLIGGENILVGRCYSILFWVLGGIPIFLMSRRIMSVNGAFAALAFYLFIPFGVFGSRSFQPDPMMVMWILWALYFQVVWLQHDNLKNALLAGIFTGIAFLVKAPTVFFVGIPLAGVILSRGIKFWIKNGRIYLMTLISILPALLYNVLSATLGGNAGSIFGARFFPQLFTSIRWYLDWLQMINTVAGHFPLVIALLAFFLIRGKENRILYGCLWLGYVIYGYVFAYHIYTHNYYQLPLLPILALGMGFAFDGVFEKLERLNSGWFARFLVMLVLVFSLGLCVQHVRGVLVVSDYRKDASYWQSLGQKIGNNADVVALTQDYGYRLNYWGHVSVSLWPTSGDRTIKNLEGASDPEFMQLFKELTLGKSAFVVTTMSEFNNQPDLKQYLLTYYPYQEGDGYFIFDLAHPLSAVIPQ